MDVKPVAGHQFGTLIVAVRGLVLKAATSQRAAAGVLQLVAPYIPGLPRVPCANSGRLWLMRLGLYELLRKKETAKDWVWIMDHTVQLGPHKCLVIVGVRLSAVATEKGALGTRGPVAAEAGSHGTVHCRRGGRATGSDVGKWASYPRRSSATKARN